MAMALVGHSYFGNIQWSIPSRILFAASFFGFIIPGWESDIIAAMAVIVGFLVTPQTCLRIIRAFTPSSSRSKAVPEGVVDGKDKEGKP